MKSILQKHVAFFLKKQVRSTALRLKQKHSYLLSKE